MCSTTVSAHMSDSANISVNFINNHWQHKYSYNHFLMRCLFIVVSHVICGGLVIGPCLILQYLVFILDLPSSHWGRERERAGCFTFMCFECHVPVIVLWLFLAVPWVGL